MTKKAKQQRRKNFTAKQKLKAIIRVFDGSPRDVHGTFYDAQRLAQRVAVILGRPAPDE